MKEKIITFIKKEVVLCIAVFLAVISAFWVKPDRQYLEYIDFRTLGILFCLMAVMAGFQGLGVFRRLAEGLLKRVKNMRQMMLILVMLCFFFSMLITNDVSLITFVPLTLVVLGMLGEDAKRKWLIPIVVLQTVAANLGSMLTPIGNPQNLYLYGISGMGFGTFLKLMLPYTAASFGMLVLWCLWECRKSDQSFEITFTEAGEMSRRGVAGMYAAVFILCLLTVARIIDYRITLVLVITLILAFDRKVIGKVDYSLLLTFVGFFVFIGNMGRVEVFRTFLENIIVGHEEVTAIAASQVISNVPAALLLSRFTEKYEALIIGTNLGGLGTLIASMASLISYKYIAAEERKISGKYMVYFTIVNVVMLAGLVGLGMGF